MSSKKVAKSPKAPFPTSGGQYVCDDGETLVRAAAPANDSKANAAPAGDNSTAAPARPRRKSGARAR